MCPGAQKLSVADIYFSNYCLPFVITLVIVRRMTAPGRPTLYKPEYAQQARERCLLGATNAELAATFDVARRTIDNWLAGIPEFAAAVREGRDGADTRVVLSLYQRAVGFRATVERTVLYRGEERTLASTVQYPPDTQACIFWLRNRRRAAWGNHKEPEPGPSADELLAALDAAGERAMAAAAARQGK